MRPRLVPCLLLFFAFLVAVPLSGQDGITQRQQEKILAKKAKEEKKAKVKKEKADRKHHLGIQDKATRKRIKQHTKRADRRGSGAHRDSWFRRTFSRGR